MLAKFSTLLNFEHNFLTSQVAQDKKNSGSFVNRMISLTYSVFSLQLSDLRFSSYKALNLAKNDRAIFCCCYISVPRAAMLLKKQNNKKHYHLNATWFGLTQLGFDNSTTDMKSWLRLSKGSKGSKLTFCDQMIPYLIVGISFPFLLILADQLLLT